MSLLDRQLEFTGHLVAGFPELGLRGWNLAGACPVTGNATQENLCKPVTTGPKDHGSDGSLQWRLSRLAELQSWGTKNFGGWRTLKAQAAFTLFETARDYPALDAELRGSMEGVNPEDVRKALDYKTERFCFEFERPNRALAGLANRQRHAASVYMIMGGLRPPVAVPKPKAPPMVAGGGVAAAGGAAAGGTAIALQNGATDTMSLVLFGIAMGIAAAVAYLLHPKKAGRVAGQTQTPAMSPLDTLTDALNQLAIAKAAVAEAADALKENVDESNNLLETAGETILTIEHEPSPPELPASQPAATYST